MDTKALRNAAQAGQIIWNKHTFERMLERSISRKEVITTLIEGEVIEDYPDDRPFTSCLLLGFPWSQPLHVVVAFDSTRATCYVITAYRPDAEHFENDHRTRIKR